MIVRAAGAADMIRLSTGGRTCGPALALETYLRLVTRAQFRVIRDGTAVPPGMAAIHVGDTAVALRTPLGLPDLRYGEDALPNLHGYLVKTVDKNTLVIRGPTEAATLFGVLGFLKRYVGVRQYWRDLPGGIGEVVPSRPTLRAPEIEWRDWPYFLSRFVGMDRVRWDRKGIPVRFQRVGLECVTLPCNESYRRWLPPEEYGATHPEYFPLIGGKRYVPPPALRHRSWQPCVSNPIVVRTMAEAVAAYFRKHPDAIGINFSVNDGHGDCECARCRAMDAPGADYSRRIGMSDRYVRLTNHVAQIVGREFPSKFLVFLAYSATALPPKAAPLHRNILPVITTINPGLPTTNAFEAWDQWMKTGARHMGLYLHHNGNAMFILPKMDVRQSARRIRYAVASGRARVFYQERIDPWPVVGAVTYVTAELLWDPRQDVDALLNEYYAGLFGPAAKAMSEFYAEIEAGYERWLKEEGAPHRFGRDVTSFQHARQPEQFRVLSPSGAARASAALARAARTKGLDARMAERLQVVKAAFRLQELCVQRYWTGHRLNTAPVRSEDDARRAVEDARRIVALSHNIGDHVTHVLERPPVDAYRLFRRLLPRPACYAGLRSGEIPQASRIAIDAGIRDATDFLCGRLGPDGAVAWWRVVRQKERTPFLIAAFGAAMVRASGVALKNLAADPGFEEIGRALAAEFAEFAAGECIVLADAQLARLGIAAPRAPYRCTLTRREARSGPFSLALQHCCRVRVHRAAHAAPRARYEAGLSVKRNAAAGAYKVIVVAHPAPTGGPAILATLPVSAQRPNEWQRIVADVVTPPTARSLTVYMYVDNQTPDARCWVDDFFIGRYPE